MLKRLLIVAVVVVAAAGMAEAAQWKIDQAHSSIGFSVSHMVISKVPGSFSDFDGSIEFEKGKLDQASVTLTAKTASIDTGNEDRDNHLKSEDFFAAETYPEITFTSTKIMPWDDNEFKLVGMLTIHGVSKEISLDGTINGIVKDPWGNTKAGFSATGSIDRKDFGMTWNKTLDAGGLVVGDEVSIMIEIEAAQVAAEGK